jgi:hypothetical protein
MEVLFWVGLSLVVGSIAGKYGRSSLGWFLLALLISPLLAMLFVLNRRQDAGAEGRGSNPPRTDDCTMASRQFRQNSACNTAPRIP